LLAHVVRSPEMPHRLPLTREDTELADRIVKRNYEEAKGYVDELQSRMPSSVLGHVLVGDHVPATLHQLVDEQAVDLVVLSAHGYSGNLRFLYGEVAFSFIMYGKTPVLIVQDIPAHDLQPTPAEVRAMDHYGPRGLVDALGTFGIEDSLEDTEFFSPAYASLRSASLAARSDTLVS